MNSIPRQGNRGESGQSTILFAFAVTAVIGFTAVVLDVGIAYHEEANLQAVADAAALAGAQELPGDPDAAVEVAEQYLVANGFDLESDEYSFSIVTPVGGDDSRISVEVDHEVSFFLGPVVGVDEATASGRAVAGAPGQDFTGMMPWAVKESAININGAPTVLKYDSRTHQNGNFGPLALGGTGSSNYEDNIKYGSQEPICAQSQPTCTDPVEVTEPGNKIGGTRDGVKYRIDNTSIACDTFSETFVSNGAGGYNMTAGCNPFLPGVTGSLRVIVVPVIDNFCNGRCNVTIKYFALLFLNTLDTCKGNNCQVTGTFAKKIYDPVAEFGYTPGEPVGGPIGLVE